MRVRPVQIVLNVFQLKYLVAFFSEVQVRSVIAAQRAVNARLAGSFFFL